MIYTIEVARFDQYGYLQFSANGVYVFTQCWWKLEKRIEAGTYRGAATRMVSKTDGHDGGLREAVFIGNNIPLTRGGTASGIFIHKDLNLKAGASDGCIVCDGHEVLKIWQQLPYDEYKVDIVITDMEPARMLPDEYYRGDGTLKSFVA